MELNFGLEFEANIGRYSDLAIAACDAAGMGRWSDCSVHLDGNYEGEYVTCDTCDGSGEVYDEDACFGHDADEACECNLYVECDCCEGNGEVWIEPDYEGEALEAVSDGPVDWDTLNSQYEILKRMLGEQDHTAGVHTHVSICCDECNHDEPVAPVFARVEDSDLDVLLERMESFVGGDMLDREYVHGLSFDGMVRSRSEGYAAVVYSGHHPTTEVRWLHSVLSPTGYANAMRMMLRYMACPDCGKPVGSEDIFTDPVEADLYRMAVEDWRESEVRRDVKAVVAQHYGEHTSTARSQVARLAKVW